MTTLPQALALAARGFNIFPCRTNSKLPAIKDYPNQATTDPTRIEDWWDIDPDFNIGISTSRFGIDQALIVVDVDVKAGKNGNESLFRLDLDGYELPHTVENSTPSGGKHLIYVTSEACKQGVDVLGSGLDIRSRGGYIVGPGSILDGKPYAQINGHSTLAQAPEWLVERLGVDRRNREPVKPPLPGIDPVRAQERAKDWLLTQAPVAVEGQAGDTITFKVAAQVKDFGCDLGQTWNLMGDFWNDRCCPPWSEEELCDKIAHAFKYGANAPGSAAPEAVFLPIAPPPTPPVDDRHPVHRLNAEYAYIKKGCFILQETTDADGQLCTEYLAVQEFKGWFANKLFQAGKGKPRPLSDWWLEWEGRREYDGFVFRPCQPTDPRFYNTWRGFAYEPCEGPANHPALDAFLEHALKNFCHGDQKICNWLLGYFAHIIQRPWEKPLTGLSIQGKKGVGKNALVERVAALIGRHAIVVDDDRYLTSNFNGHLDSCLMLVLDEAAWAGDKKAEGKLKGLTTGKDVMVERKGKEPMAMRNLCRPILMGNEDWIVNATDDERRYAAFHVGEGRMQDRKFFRDMREGMEAGGYRHLLRFLMDFDLSTVDVNEAPVTQALIEQKHASLGIVEQWWLDCLFSGQIAGGDWAGEWPETVPTNRLKAAFVRWARDRNIKSRLPEEVGFGRALHKVARSFAKRKAKAEVGDTSYGFVSPGLDVLRADWERHIGGRVDWES